MLCWCCFYLRQCYRSSKPLPFVILSAPEGSGKTLLATQIAKIFQCNFVEVRQYLYSTVI